MKIHQTYFFDAILVLQRMDAYEIIYTFFGNDSLKYTFSESIN